jgi:hypothetical protein
VRNENLTSLLVVFFISGTLLLTGSAVGVVGYYFGKKAARALVLSVCGGMLTMALMVVAVALLDGYHHDSRTTPMWAQDALRYLLMWPMSIFRHVFPPAPNSLSDGPTMEAVLATLGTDLILYSLPFYLFLRGRDRRAHLRVARPSLKIAPD